MEQELSEIQVRVLGCLLEKELSTPEYYPMSVNALSAAANQKSNREPQMSLTEAEVEKALIALMDLQFVSEKTGSRVRKFAHRMNARLQEERNLKPRQRAVLGVLMLRGPQTPAELKARAGRLDSSHGLDDLAAVQRVLDSLGEHAEGQWVSLLPKAPGAREARYAHRLSPLPEVVEAVDSSAAGAGMRQGLADRVKELEQQVADLETRLATLEEALN